MQIMMKLQQAEGCTLESVAESDRGDYLVWACSVLSSSGENYWPSLEDMKTSKQTEAYRKASDALIRIIYDVDPDYDKKLPENRWLLKHGYIDEEMKNYIDKKTKEPVDRDGNPLIKKQQEIISKVLNLQGEIIEEAPFIDDETDAPVST